jgi:hypothetical protein
MQGTSNDRGATERAGAVCVWCKLPFEDDADRKLHVSKLGAPGVFHVACFEEYEARATPA